MYGGQARIALSLFVAGVAWLAVKTLFWEETRFHEARGIISSLIILISVLVVLISTEWINYTLPGQLFMRPREELYYHVVPAPFPPDYSKLTPPASPESKLQSPKMAPPTAINDLSRTALADSLENSAGELEYAWNRYWSEDGKIYSQIQHLSVDLGRNKKEIGQLNQKRGSIKSIFTSEVREMFRDIDPYRAEAVERLGWAGRNQDDDEEASIFKDVIRGTLPKFSVDYVHKHSAYLRSLVNRLRSN
ncbi:MAG: hypothetical protein LAO19_20370 [Acidobacteriia bacterium]|nr:hypothetical protein [Terriglobia bacterium]